MICHREDPLGKHQFCTCGKAGKGCTSKHIIATHPDMVIGTPDKKPILDVVADRVVNLEATVLPLALVGCFAPKCQIVRCSGKLVATVEKRCFQITNFAPLPVFCCRLVFSCRVVRLAALEKKMCYAKRSCHHIMIFAGRVDTS